MPLGRSEGEAYGASISEAAESKNESAENKNESAENKNEPAENKNKSAGMSREKEIPWRNAGNLWAQRENTFEAMRTRKSIRARTCSMLFGYGIRVTSKSIHGF